MFDRFDQSGCLSAKPVLPVCLLLKGAHGEIVGRNIVEEVIRDYGLLRDVVGKELYTFCWSVEFACVKGFHVCGFRDGIELVEMQIVGRVVFIWPVKWKLERLREYERAIKVHVRAMERQSAKDAEALRQFQQKIRNEFGLLCAVSDDDDPLYDPLGKPKPKPKSRWSWFLSFFKRLFGR